MSNIEKLLVELKNQGNLAEIERILQLVSKTKEELIINTSKQPKNIYVTNDILQQQIDLINISKISALGKITTSIVHEIDQELTGMKLIISYFRKLYVKNILTNQELLNGLNEQDASINDISKIIKHVKNFANQDQYNLSYIHIHDTIKNCMILIEKKLKLEGINIQYNLNDQIPNIYGDPFQLELVWLNILNNAKDALNSDDNPNSSKSIIISTDYDKQSNYVIISFQDNGPGIPENIKNEIFNPFFSTKKIYEGLGLDLSISYGIIESHRGKIEVQSKISEGTTFKISLPSYKN